VIRSINIKM